MGSLIRLMAILMSLLVGIGFVTFAADELDKGSKNQQRKLALGLGSPDPTVGAIAPTPEEERAREAQHGALRETIDDANDVLLAPFGEVVSSDNAWVQRGIPTILALLLYGVGLGMLANFLPADRQSGGDWRAAES